MITDTIADAGRMPAPEGTGLLFEMLELLHPHGAAARIAQELLAVFGSEEAVLAAPEEDLAALPAVCSRTARLLACQRRVAERLRLARRAARPAFRSIEAAYLHFAPTMACCPVETGRALFLNAARSLVADEELGRGNALRVALYPGEIARRALLLRATGLILAHNHPSGTVRPSEEDVAFTHRLRAALEPLEITLHDHIILAGEDWFSFRAAGLLP